MLELEDVSYVVSPRDGEPCHLVDQVSLKVPRGHFMAIVGPSGCGKTTLLKTIAGLNAESEGRLFWDGRNLAEEGDLEAAEIGYVPQFSIAYDELSVDESIESATKLRVRTRDANELDSRIDRVLEETGLATIADRPVKVLSGGQKRRLGLAMELVSDPSLLLCDEVTSGLDPRSERDIVHLLHDLSRKDGRIVISVTHSLAHLELYDSVLVLHEGKVAYHGPPEGLAHYFSVDHPEWVYPRLGEQGAEKWRRAWLKHREAFYRKMHSNRQRKQGPKSERAELPELPELVRSVPLDAEDEEESGPLRPQVTRPGWLSQFFTLLFRRWRIFFRDRGQVALQFAILLCFPALVILFSEKANANMRKFSEASSSSLEARITETAAVREDRLKVGSAVSGMIMFQVVLLALMGSNNAAREIAGERLILEKEKFGGVRPISYLLSKVAFLAVLVLVQSCWMGFFVEFFWPFPGGEGGFARHLGFLVMVNAAMTAICLAISSLMAGVSQASLLSVYLVGFQLPLSGAVLALPATAETLTRPLISAYWAWSGSVKSLSGEHLTAVRTVIETTLSASNLSLFVLALHVMIGLTVSWMGICRHQWRA